MQCHVYRSITQNIRQVRIYIFKLVSGAVSGALARLSYLLTSGLGIMPGQSAPSLLLYTGAGHNYI